MIDTVVLMLSANEFQIWDYDKFTPSARGLFSASSGYGSSFMKCVQNPSKADYRSGIYRPRLTVSRRFANDGVLITLRIEFSAPKLIFGNNFEELNDEHFPFVLRTLVLTLGEMGVTVNYKVLQSASVAAIHYSKNVLLESTLCTTAISEIAKADPFAQTDSSQTDYQNGGYSLKWHSNSWELAIYDKVKDLEQAKLSDKRAIEKQNALQLNLFEPLRNERMEVLRIEARLGTGKKIKHILKKINLPLEKLTFENLFKKELAKKALLYFLAEVEKSLFIEKIKVDFLSHSQTYKELAFHNPNKQRQTLLRLYPIIVFIKEIGVIETRTLLGYTGKKGRDKWSRDLRAIKALEKAKVIHIPIIREIERSLTAFDSISLNGLPSFGFIEDLKKSRFQYAQPQTEYFKSRNESLS